LSLPPRSTHQRPRGKFSRKMIDFSVTFSEGLTSRDDSGQPYPNSTARLHSQPTSAIEHAGTHTHQIPQGKCYFILLIERLWEWTSMPPFLALCQLFHHILTVSVEGVRLPGTPGAPLFHPCRRCRCRELYGLRTCCKA
jgi:hypothetical protein